MINISLFRSTILQGLILGFSFTLYTILMWQTRLDSIYLNVGQYLDIAIIILPIMVVFWAIRQENSSYNVTLVQRILISIYVSAISYLIYNPFLYTYHHYINPDWFTYVLNLKEVELKNAKIPEYLIIETLQKMKNSNIAQAKLFSLSSLIPSVLIVPIFIALLSLLFIRKK